MYEEFYGLKTRCFSKTPDPAFLYMSRSHAEALARLQYAVEEREFALLTGEVGSGKTTLTRALIDSLDRLQQTGPDNEPAALPGAVPPGACQRSSGWRSRSTTRRTWSNR